MNKILPTCARCSKTFWPGDGLSSDPDEHLCDRCAPDEAYVALSADEDYEEKPPIELRTTPRSEPPEAAQVQIQPRELPGSPSSSSKSEPALEIPQTLVFNCPACMAFLSIGREIAIAGTDAPCPHCGSQVVPPRLVPRGVEKPSPESRWRPDR